MDPAPPTLDPGAEPPSAEVYRRRRARFADEERRLARVSFRFSVFRGALFLAFAACLIAILVRAAAAEWEWWAAAAFFLAAFVLVLPAHDRIIRRQRRAADLQAANDEALSRIAREWDRLPLPALGHPRAEGPAAEGALPRDLGLFGRASLFHLLGTAHTPPGKAALAGWLVQPAPPEEIARRQEAVAELAPEVELRQQIQVRARPMEKVPPDVETFLHWAEGEPWLLRRPWLTWIARLMPPVTIAALLLAIATDFFPSWPSWPASLSITVNLVLSYLWRERMEEIFNQAAAREREFRLYADAMEAVTGKAFSAPALQRIVQELSPEGRPAHAWMGLLDRRLTLADARHAALLHLPLQLLTLWDFHTLRLLERWQQAVGRRARGWLAALGELEALCALAGLRYDNPEWAFPVVAGGEDRFAARGLGHPLIPAPRRVANDVEVGPPGTFLLVTGSNMSGKSTLLRAIGINAVLAQAGGPACASSLRLPPVELGTSILIEDSLTDGVSFFMAEVLRIQRIVEAADRCRAEGRALLYLLDEILRGTNSYERQVAVRRVLLHLLRQGAIGAVSTHDLQLAGIEELHAACVAVHFREILHPGEEGPVMTFDYLLRPGVATTTNALKLMELVGLAPEG